jgi:ParB/RepB/Spo0J family partition protein
MTATATRPKAPARVQCPHCTYSGEPGSSIAGHVAMAHPDVPIATVSPKRSARNDEPTPAAPAAELLPVAGAAPLADATLAEIPLELVDVGDNVRVTLEAIDELAASIAEHGVLQPVKATLLPSGRYSLLWGQRRVLAARKAGLATIPALVYADEPDDRPIEQLVENLHRADLNPIDRARAMRAVVDAGVSQADLARKLGIAPSTVANDLRILTLDEKVIEKVATGEVTASHAKSMASLPAKQQRELAERIVEHKLSAHQIESELAWRRQTAEAEEARAKRTEKQIPKAIAALEAAEVAKGVPVNVMHSYNLDQEPLVAAIKKAGWKCTAVRLEFERKWKVESVCVDNAHADQQRTRDRVVDETARKEYEARLAAVRDEVERVIAAAELPVPVLRLLHAGIANYGGDLVVTIEDGPKAIAQELVRGWRVREMATPELLAELQAAKP